MKIHVKIRSTFKPFLDAATLRYEYLFPSLTVEVQDMDVYISGAEEGDGQEEKEHFLHLLYKEKIYADTLDIRKSIFKAIAYE